MVSRTRMLMIGAGVTIICWAIVMYIYVGRLETVSESRRVLRDQSLIPPTDNERTKRPVIDHKAAWDSIPGKGDVAEMQRKRFDDSYKQRMEKYIDNQKANEVGREPPGAGTLKTTTTEEAPAADAAHFQPQQMPEPVQVLDLDSLAMIKTDADQQKKDVGYQRFAFNLLISDRIGERRDVLDSRNELCKAQVYPSVLPKASIVICYYNEAPSALLTKVVQILAKLSSLSKARRRSRDRVHID
uniref:Uncharacterized protein n=1 Tax=Plectus sambesii TaxID=2011161 RepID=A0A914XMM9_9BILA